MVIKEKGKKLMSDNHLQTYIQNHISDFYSFAFILLPDDLQANQLVVDAVGTLLVRHKALVTKWVNMPKGEFILNQHDVKREFYRTLFELAEIRYHQVVQSLKEEEEKFEFYQLDLHKKAALYLREKNDYPVELIGYIVDRSTTEVLATLQTARSNMIDSVSL